ncbi:MAG: hypothetical protein HY657_03675 [Acidobacteria bacterium]|nr:hypothetical protein [Acidobacteriota bacterium]
MSDPLKDLLVLCGTVGLAVTLLGMQRPVQAQAGQGAVPGTQPPPTARVAAPFDPTGYWVSVITNNWRTRMVPPPLGDYRDIPLTDAGMKVADAWDPAKDEAANNECKYYGAASIMFQPARLHVTWQDDQTLRMDIDSGTQTRLFRFENATAAPGRRTWQGSSVAVSEARRTGRGASPAARYLKVTTTNMLPGYLRKNGVPYSERAVLTEYFDLFRERDGTTMMIVTIAVEDPVFLNRKYIVVAHFKKESDASRWDPSPCSARW